MTMKKCTLRLPAKLFTKLKAQADQQEKSLAAYCRQLLSVGLQVEALSQATADNPSATSGTSKQNAQDKTTDQELLWQQLLTWVLENRFLLRGLVNELLSQPENNKTELLTQSKTIANEQVVKLLPQLLGQPTRDGSQNYKLKPKN